MRATFAISSLAEMESFAESLAKKVGKSDVVLLIGPLGAGKTFLAQSLIKALGVAEAVTSPTFVMVKSYRGRFPIHHIDAYRLLDLAHPKEAFEEFDIDNEEALTIVEWGEQFDLTGEGLHITIDIGEGESRTLHVEGADSRWADVKL
jgi:tRNA threonylcarbamoyladenosine biosynthesis protein TsaE